jgi:hypothetical protein
MHCKLIYTSHMSNSCKYQKWIMSALYRKCPYKSTILWRQSFYWEEIEVYAFYYISTHSSIPLYIWKCTHACNVCFAINETHTYNFFFKWFRWKKTDSWTTHETCDVIFWRASRKLNEITLHFGSFFCI